SRAPSAKPGTRCARCAGSTTASSDRRFAFRQFESGQTIIIGLAKVDLCGGERIDQFETVLVYGLMKECLSVGTFRVRVRAALDENDHGVDRLPAPRLAKVSTLPDVARTAGPPYAAAAASHRGDDCGLWSAATGGSAAATWRCATARTTRPGGCS